MIGLITITAIVSLLLAGFLGWVLGERAGRQSERELLMGIAFAVAELDDKVEDVLYLLQGDDDGVVVEVYERDMLLETLSA